MVEPRSPVAVFVALAGGGAGGRRLPCRLAVCAQPSADAPRSTKAAAGARARLTNVLKRDDAVKNPRNAFTKSKTS
jgi:hypothetical protein